MPLDINKEEMDQAWADRQKSDKLYKFIYDIAKYQVAKKGIAIHERSDYVQFCVLKCFKHQESFVYQKGAAYSFFWKQISLAIAYKSRKEARRNNKVKTFYVEQEKVLDWIENSQQKNDGPSINEIVDHEEPELLKKTFKKYNSNHKDATLRPTKENLITVLKWAQENDPEFINKFSTLKAVFKNWVGVEAS
jgi:DNA-directed RNA polymerase specialized sigma24 family protein